MSLFTCKKCFVLAASMTLHPVQVIPAVEFSDPMCTICGYRHRCITSLWPHMDTRHDLGCRVFSEPWCAVCSYRSRCSSLCEPTWITDMTLYVQYLMTEYVQYVATGQSYKKCFCVARIKRFTIRVFFVIKQIIKLFQSQTLSMQKELYFHVSKEC